MSNSEIHLAAGRLEGIRRLLRDQHIVSVSDLSRTWQVSSATIRRDLLTLERNGTLQRVHGGAITRESALAEPLFDDKTAQSADEKRRIAAAAVRLVGPGDSIFLDGGSTILALATRLRSRNDITIVTNSLRLASELAGGGPRLILTGGELRRLSQTFVGPLTRCLLEQVQADTAFVGTIGITLKEGMTTTDPNEAFTKEMMMAHARQTIVLADSTKIGRVSFAKFGNLADVDTLITDRNLRPAMARAFRKFGLNVTAV